MKDLFVIGEDQMIYRYSPEVIIGVDSILAKIANQGFATAERLFTFDVPVGQNGNQIEWGKCLFNLSITQNKDAIYWAAVPGLVFDCFFQLISEYGSNKLVPCLDRSTGYNDNSAAFQDKLFWSPWGAVNPESGQSLKVVLSVIVPAKNNNMVVYLTFQRKSSKDPKINGNYLPILPNIYSDGRVCMGQGWDPNYEGIDSISKTVKWFFESKMNHDLAHDTVDRPALARRFFVWDNLKQTAKCQDSVGLLVNKKIGNYYLDGLPIL